MSARVLPALPPTRYNGCGDGSEPLYTPEMMRDFAEASIQLAGGAACFDQRSPAAVRLPAVAPEQFDALLAGLRLLAHELGAGRFNAHHEAAGEAYTNDGEHDGLALGGVQALDKLLIAAARAPAGPDWRALAKWHELKNCDMRAALHSMAALALEAIQAREASNDDEDHKLLPTYRQQHADANALLAAVPPRAAEEEGADDDSARTVAELREAGHAVLTFSPAELRGVDAAEVEQEGRSGALGFIKACS